MAARTSSSVGMGITVTFLGIATLALFVTSLVFFSQKNAAQKGLIDARENAKDYITDAERSQDAVQQAVAAAKKDKKSLVGYTLNSMQEIMAKTTGSKGDSIADLTRKLEKFPDGASSNLLAMLNDRESQIASLNNRVADADAARDRALADRENEARRVSAIEDANRQTLAALNGELDKYKDEVDRLRDQINVYRAELESRADKIRTDAEAVETALRADIETLQKARALAQARIAELEKKTAGQRFAGQPEYTLVDGQVIGLDATDRTAFINLGREDRLTLGMTFAVYTDASALKPDADGNLPAPKGTLEVIRIDQDTATCRILSEKKGSTMIRGDVIVNAAYDPKKVYKFVVYGNFDANRDGRFTPQEAADVRSKIAAWRGEVMEDLTGDVDFLVLGDRPVLPPDPSRNAPIEVLQEFIRLKGIRDRYDDLQRRAAESAIPVLNLNRLDTLTGGGL